MGVMFKSLTFDGTSSKTYGVYITGEAVFNAPERNVEMIDIPGRNGAYALDHGNFNNIEVTYPAGIFADNEADFAQAISDFRNFLCSKKGYCRLEDDYNTGEYREAVYKSGLEVTPALLKAGEFNITFDCKPQRFLTSGETAVAVANNGTLTNPTLFESKPILQLWGYGEFAVNGEELEIINQLVGQVVAYSGTMANRTIDTTYANNGDRIYGDGYMAVASESIRTPNATVTAASITTATDWSSQVAYLANGVFTTIKYTGDLNYGTAATKTNTFTVTTTYGGQSKTFTVACTLIYDGDENISFSSSVGTLPTGWTLNTDAIGGNTIYIDSTKSALGTPPLYFDLDIGEAYIIENGSVASVNNTVTIPAELPTLTPGTNTFTYDNTITQFKVVPRWWKV